MGQLWMARPPCSPWCCERQGPTALPGGAGLLSACRVALYLLTVILAHEELGLLSLFANSAQEKGAYPEFKSAIRACESLLSEVLNSRYSLLWVMRAAIVHVPPKLEAPGGISTPS